MFSAYLLLEYFIYIFVFVLILLHLISAIHYLFILKTLGLSKLIAFIPIYNKYKILSAYKGRVYKYNFGFLYIFQIIFSIILIWVMISVFIFKTGVINVIGIIFFIFIFAIIVGTLRYLIEYLTIRPTMYNSRLQLFFKMFFVIFIIVSVFNSGILVLLKNEVIYLIIILCIPVAYTIYCIVVAYMGVKQITDDKMTLVTKLDEEQMSKKEFALLLSMRNKTLLEKINSDNIK